MSSFYIDLHFTTQGYMSWPISLCIGYAIEAAEQLIDLTVIHANEYKIGYIYLESTYSQEIASTNIT